MTVTPGTAARAVGDRARVLEVGGEPRQPLGQAAQRGCRARPQSVQRAAHPPPPLPHLVDDVLRPGHAAARQRADALVERDVDGVEQRRDLSRAPGRTRPQTPTAARRPGARPRRAHVPSRPEPTRSSKSGCCPPMSRCGSSSSSAAGGSAIAVRSSSVISRSRPAGRPARQPVQPLIGLLLVLLEVAHRVEDHGPALPGIGMHPKHCLLRHHPDGRNAAAGFPSSRQISASRSATTPPWP